VGDLWESGKESGIEEGEVDKGEVPSRANLLPAYKPHVGKPSNPATELTLMIVPDF
jgi:hypothetical protein